MAISSICYANLLSTGTVTASTEETDYEKEHPYNGNTFDSWKPTAVPAWIKVDMSTATPVDYWALYSNDISDVGATVEFQYSDNDVDWFTIGSAVTPTNNKPITKIITSVSHRYYRLYITGAIPNINVLSFGARLDFTRGMSVGYEVSSLARKNVRAHNISATGNFIGNSVISRGFEGRIGIIDTTTDWIRDNWDNLIDHLEAKPAFFVWNNSKYPDEIVLFWLPQGIPTPRYSNTGSMSVTMDIAGINR